MSIIVFSLYNSGTYIGLIYGPSREAIKQYTLCVIKEKRDIWKS